MNTHHGFITKSHNVIFHNIKPIGTLMNFLSMKLEHYLFTVITFYL